MKIRPLGTKLFHADRQHNDANNRFFLVFRKRIENHSTERVSLLVMLIRN